MNELNILLVEDNESDISVFKSSIELFDDEHNIKTTLKVTKTFEEAIKVISESVFDGIVLDLSLHGSVEGGKEIVDFILKQKMIIPIIVYTGTPDDLAQYNFIEIYRKGEQENIIESILLDLKKTKEFGFNELFNAQGQIQEFLKDVFYKNIYFQKKQWILHEDKSLVKKAILRHTLNHLTQHIDETDKKYFLEEMYIYPPITKTPKTGSIIKDKNNQYHIILTPACDFAQSKARCILLAEIIPPLSYIRENFPGNEESNGRRDKLNTLVNNKKQEYHYLPRLGNFEGGFIDFTSVQSFSHDDLNKNFTEVKIQISPYFISDILGRFSSYYARQGQPDLHHKASYITELLTTDTRLSAGGNK
ncbi:response regulator [Acinetobacter baumannii]|uniref:response regulator n=1 Tax=Acinetobacter baumannii TaxID=470 RepID=UPI0007E9C5C9|nr:response regulator [Acinetobacter baumannii]OBA12236.1 response regulator receiver protein [Acinetobacter calcoaceticus]EHU2158610.1 response regulator [Acinetobacter baumannii]MBJ9470978.1 response regulator [Acinetobacter baumannii]MCG5905898.1 response regulator [Acinetobacter baumannii]MCJ9180147.1 response regulator [Acinetobacter baumannii]